MVDTRDTVLQKLVCLHPIIIIYLAEVFNAAIWQNRHNSSGLF